MMRLFINGSAASAGGGLTYLRNVIPQLAARDDIEASVLLAPALRQEFGKFSNLSFLELPGGYGLASRLWHEHMSLPNLIRRSGADVLISAGNFALRRAPVPQILLSRNSLYLSRDFLCDLRARGEYALWLNTRVKAFLAGQSIHWADATIAPSQAFAGELSRWTGVNVAAIPHGFDRSAFFSDEGRLPADVEQKLEGSQGCLRLLFVSHYNYYRNFETLFRAIPLLRAYTERPIRLFLTCSLRPGENPGVYRTEKAAALVKYLGIADCVVELGAIPYRSLHHLYRSCHVYISPAYAESFAHPLVEAMSCGLPVVASDLAVHREICGPAALYFERFSVPDLVKQLTRVAHSEALRAEMAELGRGRSRDFSWANHVNQLLQVAATLVTRRAAVPIPQVGGQLRAS